MRKADVTFHCEHYGPKVPAVNVKCHDWKLTPEQWASLQTEFGEGFTPDWAEKHEGERPDTWFNAACGQAWESLIEYAREIWGPGVKVYSQGRSGGWAVVEGLPDFERWDAVDLAKWARFAKVARTEADCLLYNSFWLMGANAYQPWLESTIEEMETNVWSAIER